MAEVKSVELIVPQGTTFIYEVTFVDPNNNDAPIDLTGYSARLQARDKIDSTTALYEADSEDVSPDLVVGTTDGKVTLTVPAATTALFTFKKCVFDMEIESATGVVTRLVKGTWTLDKEVTR